MATSLLTLEKFHSPEAERALIGAMFLDPSICMEICSSVEESDFQGKFTSLCFSVIHQLWSKGKNCDPIIVSTELVNRGVKNAKEELATLISDTPNALSYTSYLEVVKEKSYARKLAVLCQKILSTLHESSSTQSVLVMAQEELMKITEAKSRVGAVKISDSLAPEIDRILKAQESGGMQLAGIPTGYTLLDKMTGGLQNGGMYVVAGRPSMGKSSFLFNIMLNVVLKKQIPTLLYTLEMPRNIVIQQLLCTMASVNSRALRGGYLTPEEVQEIMRVGGVLSDSPLWIDDNSLLAVSDLRLSSRLMKSKYDIGLIVIDYLQLLSTPHSLGNRWVDVSIISQTLKIIAKELHIPILVSSQLNRQVEGREDKRPHLADLRESGSIEQDADVVMLMYRDSYYNKSADPLSCEVIVAKNRTGATGAIELLFEREYTRFKNYDKSNS